VTDVTQRGSEPFAASSSKLDQELAQQLIALAADEDPTHSGTRRLAAALIESAAWAATALAAWVAIARSL
jgi:hypothetical protein